MSEIVDNMASKDKLKDLDITEDEVKRLTEAFKKEEFRKLFAEYAEEISNPENRKRYEEEIAQLEAERGMNVKFINPEPGHVIKTSVNGEKKAFINVCKNDNIAKPTANKKSGPTGNIGLQWSIPHSFAPPKDDIDKGGQKCTVYDVVFHPDTYRMSETNVKFRQMLHDTALDGIERQFDVKLDRKNLKFPKMKYKGSPTATVIRSKTDEGPKDVPDDDLTKKFPYPYDEKSTAEKSKEKEEEIKKRDEERQKQKEKQKVFNEETEDTNGYARPNYSIKHRSNIEFDQFRNSLDARPSTRPKELVIDIDLPLLKSAVPVDLDIFEKKLELKSEEPAKYKLDLNLPYPVDENNGHAKFDKSKKRLVITLPVLPDKSADTFFDEIRNVGKDPLEIGESRKDETSGLNEEGKPLIEVIASKEDEESVDVEDASTTPSENNKDNVWTENEVSSSKQAPKVTYVLPEYEYDQDIDTVTLVIHVKNVETDTVTKSFPESDQKQVQITFVSMGSGCFPVHYSIFLKFDDGCKIDPEGCNVDVSADNVVVVLNKTKLSWSWWDRFEVGLDANNLEVILDFVCSQLILELIINSCFHCCIGYQVLIFQKLLHLHPQTCFC